MNVLSFFFRFETKKTFSSDFSVLVTCIEFNKSDVNMNRQWFAVSSVLAQN